MTSTILAAGCIGDNAGTGSGTDPVEGVSAALVGDPCTTDTHCNDGNPCTMDKCVQRKCAYTGKADGTACSDGNACTTTDTCEAGVCMGGTAVVCAPPNQCQIANGCNPSSGKCIYFAKSGAACDDRNSCTQNDQCTTSAAGVCKGTRRSRGSACDDGNSCTQGDQCTSGGTCVGMAQPNGSVCDDGNPSTVGDVCAVGTCSGVDHCVGVICAASDQCHLAGICIDHATGACSNPTAPDGTMCDDGNSSTTGDTCAAGVCAGTQASSCSTNNSGCSANATCTDAQGTRTCACNSGYTGDGMTCSPVVGGEDTTAPTLTALSFSSSSVDTTSADATVTASYAVTDDLSGVFYLAISFTSPSGAQGRAQGCFPSPGALSATSTCSVKFPAFGEAGTWTAQVLIDDVVGNRRILATTDLQALGLPGTLNVVSKQDTTAPMLAALSFDALSVDTTSADASLTASYAVTDDLSGVFYLAISFTSPSGAQGRAQGCFPSPGALSATSTCSVKFPAFGEAGTWTAQVLIDDLAGNRSILSEKDLQALGLPGTLNVVSKQDTTAPMLMALSFGASSIDTTSADATLTASYSVTDDLSGVFYLAISFTSPSGAQGRAQGCFPSPGNLSATSTCSIKFPAFGETGTWTAQVLIDDVVGNRRILSTTDLQALGFPGTLKVGAAPISVAAGGAHTCGLFAGGTVRCWGYNLDGELGNGTTTNSSAPVAVPTLSGVRALAAGAYHTCALLSDATVRCWGRNASGQLGDGTTTNASIAVTVAGLAGVTALSAGFYHTCALLSSGTVRCWGWNTFGELGDGTTVDSSTPVTVSNVVGATAISAGLHGTCALSSTGRVQCWGYNGSGQLGDGTTTSSSNPVVVSNLSNATAISGTYTHTCALLAGGTLRCWGYNGSGQLGDGTTTSSAIPIAVPNLDNVGGVSAGEYHTCALISGGTVQCWGLDTFGQLGDGTTTDSPIPVAVLNVGSVASLSAGASHTCGVTAANEIACWGINGYGQLGNGATTSSSLPVTVQW